MTTEEARQLIGVDGTISSEELEAAFHQRFRELESKLERAPTPSLKEKYRRGLTQLEEAWEILSGTDTTEAAPNFPTLHPIAEREVLQTSPGIGRTGEPEVEPPRSKKSYAGLLVMLGLLLMAGAGLGWYFGIEQPAVEERLRQAQLAEQAAIEKEKDAEAKAAADEAQKAEALADQNVPTRQLLLRTANHLVDFQRTTPDTTINAIIQENHLHESEAFEKLDDAQIRDVLLKISQELIGAVKTDPVLVQWVEKFGPELILFHLTNRLIDSQQTTPDSNIQAIIQENHLDDPEIWRKLGDAQSLDVLNQISTKLILASPNDSVARQLMQELGIQGESHFTTLSPDQIAAISVKKRLMDAAHRLVDVQSATPDNNINAIIQVNHLDDNSALEKLDAAQSQEVLKQIALALHQVSETDAVASQLVHDLNISFTPTPATPSSPSP